MVLASHLHGEGFFSSERFPVVPVLCEGPFDYWRGVAAPWDSDATLVLLEHDMECSDALVSELLACPHPACSHAYQMHIPRTYWAHNVSTAGWHPPIDPLSQYTARGIRWVAPGDEWADFSGIGFCKLTPAARTTPLRRDAWQGVEISVNAAINARWHLHWPGVEHYHHD